jgi:hypothetical protein
MNQRIRELVKQSGGEFWQRLENDAVNPEAYITFDPPASLDKFVELIVKECVTIINHGIDHTDYPHPSDTEKSMVEMKAQIWCRDAIKEHFGVK